MKITIALIILGVLLCTMGIALGALRRRKRKPWPSGGSRNGLRPGLTSIRLEILLTVDYRYNIVSKKTNNAIDSKS
jgi:hypothetical protein